jgi:hypothetical protein
VEQADLYKLVLFLHLSPVATIRQFLLSVATLSVFTGSVSQIHWIPVDAIET